MKKKTDVDMLHGSLWKNILRYAVPIMLTTLLQLFFHSADLIVVGNFAGSDSLAAVGATGSISNLVVSLFMGLSVGAGVTVAHALGSKNYRAITEAVHTAIPLAAICGAVLTVVGILLARPLLVRMNTPANILDKATLYMQIYFAGIVAIMLYNFGGAILRAAGDSKSPLFFLFISGGLNVVLNVIFVALFHMDVAGVALATTLTNALSAVLVLLALCRRTDACRLSLKKMRIYKAPFREILRIGIPSGIQSSLFTFANTIIQSSVNSFGSVVVSGKSAASNLDSIIGLGSTAFGQTAINFTAQNMGAGNYKRIHRILHWCFLQSSILALLLGSVAFLFRYPILEIYLPDSPESVYWGAQCLQITALLFPIANMMDISSNVLRGMGKSILPTVISILCICGFRLLWNYTVFQIPAFHTIQSIQCSFPISWFLSLSATYVTYLITYRQLRNR